MPRRQDLAVSLDLIGAEQLGSQQQLVAYRPGGAATRAPSKSQPVEVAEGGVATYHRLRNARLRSTIVIGFAPVHRDIRRTCQATRHGPEHANRALDDTGDVPGVRPNRQRSDERSALREQRFLLRAARACPNIRCARSEV